MDQIWQSLKLTRSLRGLGYVTLLGGFGLHSASAVIPSSSGQNTASGGIVGAVDNPPLSSDDLSIVGGYANGNGGSNADGSWSVSTGGTFAYRGVALSSESNVQSFNQNADLDTGQTADAEGVGSSGESGTSSAYVSGGIDILSIEIGRVDASGIEIFSQFGEDYFSPVPELSLSTLYLSTCAILYCWRRRPRSN